MPASYDGIIPVVTAGHATVPPSHVARRRDRPGLSTLHILSLLESICSCGTLMLCQQGDGSWTPPCPNGPMPRRLVAPSTRHAPPNLDFIGGACGSVPICSDSLSLRCRWCR